MVKTDEIKQLRQKTGAGIMECKAVLLEAEGKIDKAVELLRKRGLVKAREKAHRTAKEGRVESYIHLNSKIGVLVEVNCETDFVARCDDFREFTRNVAMHIAAAKPLYIKKEDVPQNLIDKEKDIIKSQIKDKPDNVKDKIVDGKIGKYFEEICLLDQPYVKDDKITVGSYLNAVVGKIGENISIKRFTRYELGEEA